MMTIAAIKVVYYTQELSLTVYIYNLKSITTNLFVFEICLSAPNLFFETETANVFTERERECVRVCVCVRACVRACLCAFSVPE